jgi:hypothetical protein
VNLRLTSRADHPSSQRRRQCPLRTRERNMRQGLHSTSRLRLGAEQRVSRLEFLRFEQSAVAAALAGS